MTEQTGSGNDSPEWRERNEPLATSGYSTAGQAVKLIPLAELQPADSPRLVGEDPEHIRLLAEPGRALPPVVVHRSTMRVIDGMHRVSAARLRGDETIEVVFFDGTDEDAFVLAVRANIAHGLPLSYADREAAVARIVLTHPDWSDRAIAATTGLAPRTVASVRSRIGGLTQETARVGRDGRVRPLDSSTGRRMASRLIAAFPDASLRQIARAAGISPATVRDVRERIRRGEDPVPARRARGDQHGQPATGNGEPARGEAQRLTSHERNAVLENLERDPSLRFAESGTRVLRWLARRIIAEEEWRDVAAAVPPHSVYILATLARRCGNEWHEFAQHLERRVAEP